MIAVRFDRANIYRDTRLFKHKSETESKARPEKSFFCELKHMERVLSEELA